MSENHDPLEEGYVSSEAAQGGAPDESQNEDLHEEQPGEALTQGDVPQMEPLCGLCYDLATFLREFDPTLQGTDWNPVEVATARLTTQAEYLTQFTAQAGDLRAELEALRGWEAVAIQSNRDVDALLRNVMPDLQEKYGMPVDGVRLVIEDVRAQKDVRDERIGVIQAILRQKVGDSAKIARIQQLFE